MEQKTCKQCGEQFEVTDNDLAFLEKISPEFGGKKYLISPPTLCHVCRQTRRLVWRNERCLYKRPSDKSGSEIISIYSPDKKDYKVFSSDEYQADDWDALQFGQEYNHTESFFAQFDRLMYQVPRKANNSTRNENSDFCNQTWQSKNSYLCFNVGYAEDCYYCTEAFHVKNCVDCFDVRNCEYCYGCFDCGTCHNCQYLDHCKDCSESYFLYDCSSCRNCYMSSGLHNEQYYFENQKLSKEEYEKKIGQIDLGKRSTVNEQKTKFVQMKNNAVHKPTHNINSEQCTGDYLIECNNCDDCYNAYKSEGCCRVAGIDDASKDCRDMDIITEAELCYEGTSMTGHKNLFSIFVVYGSDNMYCNFCENCNNCFGCIGLNKKQYCILNKQYTKEEYESLMPKIIDKMIVDGEWGEFFSPSISPFGYNETLINLYQPKSKEEAVSFGAKWLDEDYSMQFNGQFFQPDDDIKIYRDNDDQMRQLLNGVLKCEKSGKAFKIMPQELAFYVEHNIPIPIKHSEERFMELFKLRNPRMLYDRECMCNESGHGHEGKCQNKFKTTYAPDRPEKVYCENCYNKTVL